MQKNVQESDGITKEPTQIKAIRLKESVIKSIEQLANIDNRNFSNMAETLIMKGAEQMQTQL